MKPRMTWADTTPFPDNPIFEGRLTNLTRRWGGYRHDLIDTPLIFDNTANAFPEYPPETLFVGDGNHRRELARRHEALNSEFIARLHRGLTAAEMYEKREGSNDRRTVKPAEVFLQRAARFPHGTEAAIKAEVEGLGWVISYERESGGLPYVNELRWLWERNKAAPALAIRTYEAAFGRDGTGGQGAVLKGLGAFWLRYPGADADRVLKALKAIEGRDRHGEPSKAPADRLQALYRSGKAARSDRTYIKSTHDGVRHSVAMDYNASARKGHLPV